MCKILLNIKIFVKKNLIGLRLQSAITKFD